MKIIDFEGIDGSSKTTSLKFVAEQLRERGYRVIETREVGNTHIPTAVKLREIVLSPDSEMNGRAMELVFSAMRLMNQDFYKKVEGEYDFCLNDRGWFSHLAYTDHNVDEAFTYALYPGLLEKYSQFPNIVIHLVVNPQTALERRHLRNGVVDVIEAKGPIFQEKVAASFEKWKKRYASQVNVWNVIADGDLASVQKQLLGLVDNLDRGEKVGC